MPLPMQLWHLAAGHIVSAATQVAAKLAIADLLVGGPLSVDQLAQDTQTDPRSLLRVLRALASVGVFQETRAGVFAQSELSEFLRSDVAGSQRSLCIANSQPDNWRAFAGLDYSVRTGKPALEQLTGKSFFEVYSNDPYYSEAFHSGMSGLSELHSFAVNTSYDFSTCRRLCDIGGGYGHLLGTILEANPTIEGVLFDIPDVINTARTAPAKEVLHARAELVEGDFFVAVPPGCDTYLMKLILHDWDDDHATTILQNIRTAMSTDSTLLVVDAVIPPGNEPSMNKLLDLQMLVALSGRERTEEEFRKLMSAAGLRLDRVIPTPSPVSILQVSAA